MFHALVLLAALTGTAPGENSASQSKNGEFIFSQYPPRAKAAGEQGSVRFQAEVDAKGNVMSCKVTASSGFERLDRETCEMIVRHASFRPTLDSEGKARGAVHDGMVNWRISGQTPTPAKLGYGGKSPDEIVCRRSAKTGSLVLTSRTCLTRKEWARRAEAAQAEWADEKIKGWMLCGEDPYPAC